MAKCKDLTGSVVKGLISGKRRFVVRAMTAFFTVSDSRSLKVVVCLLWHIRLTHRIVGIVVTFQTGV